MSSGGHHGVMFTQSLPERAACQFFFPQPEQVQRRIWMPSGSITGGKPSHNPARKAKGSSWGFSKAIPKKKKERKEKVQKPYFNTPWGLWYNWPSVLLTVRFLQHFPKWHIYRDMCSGLRLLRPAAPRFIFKLHHIASHISLSLGQLSESTPAVNKSSKASQSDWNAEVRRIGTECVAKYERKVRSLACAEPGAAWRWSSWHH